VRKDVLPALDLTVSEAVRQPRPLGWRVGAMAGSTISDALYAGGKVLLKTLTHGLKEAGAAVLGKLTPLKLFA